MDVEFEVAFDRYAPIPEFLQYLPSLRSHHHFDARSSTTILAAMQAHLGLRTLQPLHLQRGDINMTTTARIVTACGALRELTFWPEDFSEFYDFSILYPAPRSNKETLDRIELSVGTYFMGHIASERIGSFHDFERLSRLRIPEVVIMGMPEDHDILSPEEYECTTYKPEYPLIRLLPSSLIWLNLSSEFTNMSDTTEFLWDFVGDAAQLLRLEAFRSEGRGLTASFEKLPKEFGKRSVQCSNYQGHPILR